MPSKDVILRVIEISAQLKYGKAAIRVEPAADTLLLVSVPSNTTRIVDGLTVFNVDGIRHIVKCVRAALIVDADRDDF